MENKEENKKTMSETDVLALGAALSESLGSDVATIEEDSYKKAKTAGKIAIIWLVVAICFVLASVLILFIMSIIGIQSDTAETVIGILFAVIFLSLGVFLLINYKLMKQYSEWRKYRFIREAEEYHKKYGSGSKKNKK